MVNPDAKSILDGRREKPQDERRVENKQPIYDDGKMIVEEGHMALKDKMMFSTRKYRLPYGLEELELR